LKLTVSRDSRQLAKDVTAKTVSQGMIIKVRKAGTASPRYFQLISTTFRIIRDPEMTSAPPVAQGGMEAKTAEICQNITTGKGSNLLGAKKIEMKKQRPPVIAVKPVFPPSEIP